MKRLALALLCVFLWGCTHAAPQLNQIFTQVNRVYDPDLRSWSPRLSVFVQGSSADGTKVFDRLYILNDDQNLFFSLTKDLWSVVDKPGEFWVGANGLAFPDEIPTGTWRVILVTRSGQRLESSFALAPQPLNTPAPSKTKVAVTREGVKYRVTGWVDDYVVWARDEKGLLLSQAKTVGPLFSAPAGAKTFELYSYDKIRGEGLLAGPFPVQPGAGSADS